jgi:hypothetical protein
MPLPGAPHPTMQTAALPAFPNGSAYAGRLTLVFRVRHRDSQTLLHEHRLLLMPQRFTQSTESRSALYYTQGGPVADTLKGSAIGITYFSVSGHTGFGGLRSGLLTPVASRLETLTTPEIFARTVNTLVTTFQAGGRLPLSHSLIDGAAGIKDLQDTLLSYFAPQDFPDTRDATQTQDLQLEFLNLSAPTSEQDRAGRAGWIIHPHRNLVDIQQDASKPFLYAYTLQFAALSPLAVPVLDDFSQEMTTPQTGLQTTLRQITQVVTDLTNGVNTIEDAFTQMSIQQVTGPVSTFLLESGRLGDALGHFMESTADKIRFPLYAQRLAASVLDAPKHSVTTLRSAAQELAALLRQAADPRSLGRLLGGTALTAGANDLLTVRLNQEVPQTLTLGTQTSGSAIAATIQSQVRALAPEHAANASAYRDFTCTFTAGQYQLSSGTKASDSGRVEVVVSADPALTPADASSVLGLGVSNGGHEQAGSALPNAALALLRGLEQACTHLQGFPDYFADQLPAQDAVLTALLPPGVTRAQIRGDQRLQQTRITPGDSLQGIAARVGTDWQTLALVNRLTFPYILEGPTTLARGRTSSATFWTLEDEDQHWGVDAFQGQRLDIVYGTGAGQSRRILRNTATALVLETAWDVVPTDTSDYAIRSALNPIVRTGTVSAAGIRTLTESSLHLVPGSQRGLTLVLTSGDMAGERRPVTGNDATTYTVDPPWTVIPNPGSLYLLEGPRPATERQKVVGDWLSVPRPSAQTPLPIRTRLQDVSAITGRRKTVEERLFGRDAVLSNLSLVYDPGLADLVTLAGLPNLRQALIHYVNLPIGELEYAPGTGSYIQETLGLQSSLPLQIELLASLQRTVKQDPRIASLGAADVVASGGMAVMTFAATAINGATVAKVTVR